MKKCFKCLVEKDLSEFYTHKQMADGHLNKCKECTKKDGAIRWADPEARERIRAYDNLRTKTQKRKEDSARYLKNRRLKNPDKKRAWAMISYHLRMGNITRKPCEVCGDVKAEAHHDDYSKPLDVRWLCFTHHREAHGQKPKVKSAGRIK